MADLIASLSSTLPELLLAVTICALVVAEVVGRGRWAGALALVGVGASSVALLRLFGRPETLLFSGMVALDPFSLYFKLVFLLIGALVILLSMAARELRGRGLAEYYALLLTTTLGMFLLASATDLLMIYLSLELVSIPCFILAGYRKEDPRSAEASLKYVLYGAVSSGVMVYGMSLLYGLTGTTKLSEMNDLLRTASPYALTVFVAIVLILVGLGYKVAAVPFHFWAPDVFEGAPTPVTAFLSVGPKAAGFAILVRFLHGALAEPGMGGAPVPILGIDWPLLLALISAATMTVGNLAAIPQTNLKRLLAYSSIAHVGYILMGAVLLSPEGLRAILFYLVVYLLMNLGAFLVVVAVANATGSEEIEAYRGLVWRSPFAALAMAVFLFALTGIPPTGGFVGKFYLFAAVIRGEYYWLAVIGVLNSVVSLYYYARVIRAMFLEEARIPGALAIPWAHTALLGALALPLLVLGVYWAPLARLTDASLRFLLQP